MTQQCTGAVWHDGGVSSASLSKQTASISRRGFLVSSVAVGAGIALVGCEGLIRPVADSTLKAMYLLAVRDTNFLAGTKDAATRQAAKDCLAAEINRSCGQRDDGTQQENCGVPSDPPPEVPTSVNDIVALLEDSRSNELVRNSLDSTANLTEPYEVNVATAVDAGMVLALRNNGAEWEMLVPKMAITAPVQLSQKDIDALGSALSSEYALIYSMGTALPHLNGELSASATTSADRHRVLRDRVIDILMKANAAIPQPSAGYVPLPESPDLENHGGKFCADLELACMGAWQQVIASGAPATLRLFALQSAGLASAGAAIFSENPTAALPNLSAAN